MKIHGNRISLWITVIILMLPVNSLCQQGSYYFRVYLKDKGTPTLGYSPSELLSERAIARREKAGIQYPDFKDMPVNREYLSTIKSLGLTLHSSSKWMNTALFSGPGNSASLLQNLNFVSRVEIVRTPFAEKKSADKFENEIIFKASSQYDQPVRMVNGHLLHEAGFTGKNILIAVLDGGFFNANTIESLERVRSRNGIKYTYDFVDNDNFVYEASVHGTAVLSILAGSLPGSIAGSAPDADYILLRTEDVFSEFPCEEDFWAAGAEFADSAGADIISSSLGYTTFDDPAMNYSHDDLDGNTAFITKVADIAASKGIAVFNSAGNERNSQWFKISFPADGDSVVAVAAVDASGLISNFSSAGFSADGRVKPDISAMGVSVPIQSFPSATVTGNGTSFSCPVMSGLAACLMQAVPEAVNMEIITRIKESADMFSNPDYLYGYGIPDMADALKMLREVHFKQPDEGVIAVPNPSTESFYLVFSKAPGQFHLEIFSLTGKLISSKEYPNIAGTSVLIDELTNREQGLYILKIITPEGTLVCRVIKLKN